MPQKINKPKEGDELFHPNKDEPVSVVRVLAGESLNPAHWLVYDSVGMPREVKHSIDRWVITE